jgi:hypothetical protein
VEVGGSAFTLANPDRRWVEIDFDLPDLQGEEMLFTIDALPQDPSCEFTAFSYELLCRGRARLVFSDGFEGGDTSRWSRTQP